MRVIPVLIMLLMATVSTELRADAPTSQPTRIAPATAKTTEAILKAIEPLKGFGDLQTAQYCRWGRQVFAVWYCPFSGRGDCYLHAYYYDYEKAEWTRFIDRLVPTGGDLSPEMPSGEEILFRSSEGIVVVRESVAAFPTKNSAK